MATSSSSHRLGSLFALLAFSAGCAGGASNSAPLAHTFSSIRRVAASAQTPMLIGDNFRISSLVSWPLVSRGGGKDPNTLAKPSGLNYAGGMAAAGGRIAIANTLGYDIVVYDLRTKEQDVLPDTGGYPIDVAIGSDGTIYAANTTYHGNGESSISVYPPKTRHETVLTCSSLQFPSSIAVDRHGDIFVQQDGTKFLGVLEFPHDVNGDACRELQLKPESFYATGIAIDPKTDDLLVLDSGDCAGGPGGTLTTYPRPYKRATGRSIVLHDDCPAMLRLDADSTFFFVGDSAGEGGAGRIAQFSYPAGNFVGAYYGGLAIGFTTIPNTLPN